MPRASILSLKWDHQYVAVFKCFSNGKERKAKEYVVEELKVADSAEIRNDSDLQRVLEALRRDLVERRIYQYADNPTSRLLTFRSHPDGRVNEGQQCLSTLLKASSVDEVRAESLALANRYKQIPNIREGVLIFLISQGMLDNHSAQNCVFIFKCDFEAISQITSGQLFRQVEDAIVERTRKGALYPYFHQKKFDVTTIRVFDDQRQTQYWLDFLGLGARRSERVSLQDELVARLPHRVIEKYADQLEAVSSGRAVTDDEQRLVDREDRLSTQEIQKLGDRIVSKIGKQTVRLRLGGVTISAPINQYGRTWIVAEEAGQCYVLIKGAKLESGAAMLTPIDWADFGSLQEALAELGL